MKLKDLMETTPETLAARQRDALIEHVVARLDAVRDGIKKGSFSSVYEILFDSPAGDGYGSDNRCINFDYSGSDHGVLDIGEIVNEIDRLNDLCGDAKLGPTAKKSK